MSYKSQDIINFLDSILAEAGTTADGEPNKLKNEPSQDPGEEFEDLEDDLGYDEDDMDTDSEFSDDDFEDEDEEDEDEEDEIIEMASTMVDAILLEQDNKYQEYFRGVMKKHGFNTLTQMRDDQKKAFFKDVKSGWNKVGENFVDVTKTHRPVTAGWSKEDKRGVQQTLKSTYGAETKPGAGRGRTVRAWHPTKGHRNLMPTGGMPKFTVKRDKHLSNEAKLYEDYEEYFRNMMKDNDIKNIDDLSDEEKKDFFNKVDAGWKSKEEKGVSEQTTSRKSIKEQMEDAYRKYFKYMLEKCEIYDLKKLSEEDRVQFYSLVNEAFVIFHLNEQMQRPGAPIENPMSPHQNMLGAMRRRLRPEEKLGWAGSRKAMQQAGKAGGMTYSSTPSPRV
jgi:hypothetical protein